MILPALVRNASITVADNSRFASGRANHASGKHFITPPATSDALATRLARALWMCEIIAFLVYTSPTENETTSGPAQRAIGRLGAFLPN